MPVLTDEQEVAFIRSMEHLGGLSFPFGYKAPTPLPF